MDTDQQSAAVHEFCAVTSTTPEQARFFLESCTWRLDSALHSFYESAGDDNNDYGSIQPFPVPVEEDDTPSIPRPHSPTGPASAEVQRASVAAAAPNPSRPDRMSGRPNKDKRAARVSAGSGGGIKTLSDLNKPQDSDSDSDGPQEYYTGGEKSGMMVQDPSKGQKEVESIFERARQFGAREGNFEAPSASSGSRGSFVGTGRTLLGDVRQDQGQEKEAGAGNLPPEPVAHTITFWRNGFTVDDGPLRRLEDRANAPFLQSINRGECPSELEPNDRSIAVHVSLVKKDDEWQPPAEPRYRAFQGTGRTLGGASQSPSALSPLQSSGGLEVNAQPVQGLVVDDLKPSTSIQLRLSDGTRMVARFNHHHTIADIRGFIDAARPGSSRSYQLQIMGFPPKTLLNPTETVAQAGLLNAVVIQKV